MTTRAEIVEYARSAIGTPFHHQAYNIGVGVDCAGLLAAVGLRFGLVDPSWVTRPDCHNYSEQPNPRKFVEICESFLDPIELDDIQPADVLIMRFEIDPMHLALVTELKPLHVVHALSRYGFVAEHNIDAAWGSKLLRAYRYRGLPA